MKKFKLVLVLLVGLTFTSCSDVGTSEIEKDLVVEKIESTKNNDQCSDCLQNSYSYRVQLQTKSGHVYYYTDYKHEVGDTLVSIFEFTDNREGVIKKNEYALDSLTFVNKKIQKKNNELELYNELLMGIIQDNVLKETAK